MPGFGRTIHETTGRPLQVSADGAPEWKHGGVTIDWDTVTAVGSETTLADGTVVAVGDKYLLYGTVLDKITASGKYGPADTTESDGRQTLATGETYILNETVVASEPGSDHPPVLEGGRVFEDRLQDGVGNQPALAAILAALPRLRLVKEGN